MIRKLMVSAAILGLMAAPLQSAEKVRSPVEVEANEMEIIDADKQAIAMVHSPHFRGYNQVGAELTRGKADWREQIDIGAEREAVPQDLIGALLFLSCTDSDFMSGQTLVVDGGSVTH